MSPRSLFWSADTELHRVGTNGRFRIKLPWHTHTHLCLKSRFALCSIQPSRLISSVYSGFALFVRFESFLYETFWPVQGSSSCPLLWRHETCSCSFYRMFFCFHGLKSHGSVCIVVEVRFIMIGQNERVRQRANMAYFNEQAQNSRYEHQKKPRHHVIWIMYQAWERKFSRVTRILKQTVPVNGVK